MKCNTIIVGPSLFAPVRSASPHPSLPLRCRPLSSPLLSSPSSSFWVSFSLVLFLLLSLGIQPCYCRFHSQRQSPMFELSTKTLPFKNSDLKKTCICRYLLPFPATYKTQRYALGSTACCRHDSSQWNWVNVQNTPQCVQVGRPQFSGDACSTESLCKQALKMHANRNDRGCSLTQLRMSFIFFLCYFLSSELLLIIIKGI